MPAEDALLFIDSNKYLDLYQTDKGKKLLAPLGEQKSFIFVTRQIVAEVQRRKILVAAEFLGKKAKGMKVQNYNIPDHLSAVPNVEPTQSALEKLTNAQRMIGEANSATDAWVADIMQQISRSEDEVSKALSPIFANAIEHTAEELQRARYRKELGNPPGKGGSIGDQLNWEQILSNFQGKKRLWIISRDGDYGTDCNGIKYLNQFLLTELKSIVPDAEAYFFEDTVDGIQHFVKTTGVKAEKRLTPEETVEVETEERSLAPLTVSSDNLHSLFKNIVLCRIAANSTEMSNVISAAFLHSITNSVGLSDASSQTFDKVKMMSEAMKTLSESDVIYKAFSHLFADSVGLSDASSQTIDKVKMISEAMKKGNAGD